MSKKPEVIVYTDGACSGNPGPGGWGAILKWNGKEKELSGGDPLTTNNRMEMQAVIEALKALKKPCVVKIHSDSALIINAFTQGWIENWQKKGWRKSDKKPVENKELWQDMLEAMKPHEVVWVKVKGHSGIELNERADQLAVAASQRIQNLELVQDQFFIFNFESLISQSEEKGTISKSSNCPRSAFIFPVIAIMAALSVQ